MIDNAVKFTPEHGTVEVGVFAGGDTTTVQVTDTGPGLTDDELARMGDRFWRSGRHQNIKGSGLGLSITRALLAATGCSIAYGHHDPEGLRVTVTLLGTPPPRNRVRA